MAPESNSGITRHKKIIKINKWTHLHRIFHREIKIAPNLSWLHQMETLRRLHPKSICLFWKDENPFFKICSYQNRCLPATAAAVYFYAGSSNGDLSIKEQSCSAVAVGVWKVSGSLFRTRRGKDRAQSYHSTTFTYFNKSPTYFYRTAATWTCGQFILRTWQQCPSAPQRGKRHLVDGLQTKWLAHNTVKQDNNSYNTIFCKKNPFSRSSDAFQCIFQFLWCC